MKKKALIILLVVLIIVTIISAKIVIDRRERKSKELFEMSLITTFYDAIKSYQEGTKYIVRSNGKLCDTDIKMPSSNYNYYIKFNDEGKISEYYFYSKKWLYKNDNINSDNLDQINIVKNTNNFEYDCPNND